MGRSGSHPRLFCLYCGDLHLYSSIYKSHSAAYLLYTCLDHNIQLVYRTAFLALLLVLSTAKTELSNYTKQHGG